MITDTSEQTAPALPDERARRRPRWLTWLVRGGLVVLVLLCALVAFVAWALTPRHEPRPLPAGLVDGTSSAGRALLDQAQARADYAPLTRAFEPQALRSYCGVASSVAVLRALSRPVTQDSFFTEEARTVRPRWKTMLMGMPLDALAQLLRAHHVDVRVHRADALDLASLRALIARNLARPGDYLLANYERAALGQGSTGHISPLAAYERTSDRVLVLDTARYSYPPTWVELAPLLTAMQRIDADSGKPRGLVEVLPQGASHGR